MNSSLRVLMVEDNPVETVLVRIILSRSREPLLEFETVETLAAAVSVMSSRSFDAVLLDLGLPDSQGIDTLRELRRHSPAVSILVLTGSDDNQMALETLREGAQDFLRKGQAEGEQLIHAIQYAVERQALQSKGLDAARRTEERLALLSAFVTHDLRSSLVAVLGSLDTLDAMTPDGAGYREQLTRLRSQAVQMLEDARKLPDSSSLRSP